MTFSKLVDAIGRVVESVLVPLLFALALMYFLYGVLGFIRNAGNDEKRAEYRKVMGFGLIGLAVMMSVWGLVEIVAGTIGQSVVIPQIRVNDLK
jgi:hypothetical protein